MKIAVICPGPSLSLFNRTDEALVIGVNRAVLAVACDYWSFRDLHTFDWCVEAPPPGILGKPIIATYFEMARDVRKKRQGNDWQFFNTEDVEPRSCTAWRWSAWSSHAALATAVHLGATLIECYGMDWAGVSDFDGFHHVKQKSRGNNRRWKNEADTFGRVTGILAQRGVELRRVTKAAARSECHAQASVNA